MNLRNINISTRLGAGFGLILLAASAMLAGSLASASVNRQYLLQTLQYSAQNQAQAAAMRETLLSSAVAARNMGLQTTMEGVQKDEAEAKKHRANYLAALQRLEASGLNVGEREPLARLAAIDAKMDAQFKEAVDMAATFNVEQAGAIITKQIDPLLKQSMIELEAFGALQKEHAAAAAQDAGDAARLTERVSIAAGVVVILGSALLAWRLTVSITRPLQAAEQATARIAAGDLASDIPVNGRDEAARLLDALRDMRHSLADVVSHVRQNSENVATASSQIAEGNNDLSVRTEQQASALQQAAAAMEELGTAVRHNADNARQANQLAQGASHVASRGGEVVSQVVDTMKGINDSSRRIADIIGVIDGIAFQTNILALNAAVEAARAGEQGRGFAVVASEVRSLAQRSAAAAREIKGLISTSVERVAHGSTLVDQAGSTMQEIVGAIRRVTDIMGEISSASVEQSSGVTQVGQSVTQMDHATQQNAALVEESAAAADSLKTQARELVNLVAVFKLG